MALAWYRPSEKRVEPTIQVKLADGSKWEAKDNRVRAGKGYGRCACIGSSLDHPSGVPGIASWKEISELNFSAANVVWLASQTPLVKKIASRSLLKQPVAGREEMLGPRFLSVDGDEGAQSQDLRFIAPGEMVFRIPGRISKFVAKVDRYDRTEFASTVQCQVWVGDRLAWNMTIAPDSKRLPSVSQWPPTND